MGRTCASARRQRQLGRLGIGVRDGSAKAQLMAESAKSRADWRPAALMAIFALLLQAAIPPGFMLARSDHGPAVVLCSGHGPLLLDQGGPHGQPGKSPASKAGGVCPFAGHGGPSIAPAGVALSRAPLDATPSPDLVRLDLWPGRGLAAPPPPSQAPPSV